MYNKKSYVHKYNSKDLRGLPTHTNSFTDISTFSGSSLSFALDDVSRVINGSKLLRSEG